MPNDAVLTTFRIKAYSPYMFGLIRTKPLHTSQRVVTYPNWKENRNYGEFEVTVYPNNEFFGTVRYYGEELEIVSSEIKS